MKRLYLAGLFLAFCAAQAELPPLIPREILFGNPVRSHPQISPDGEQLAWLAPDKNGVVNVWIGSIDRTKERAVTNETSPPDRLVHVGR